MNEVFNFVGGLTKPYLDSPLFVFYREFTVPFPDAQSATMVKNTCEVDEELKLDRISKTLTIIGNELHVKIAGKSAKDVRVVTSSLIEMLQLSTKTIAVFA